MTSYSSSRKPRFVSILDIGSSKIVCMIAKIRPLGADNGVTLRSHAIEIVGFGMQAAKGIKSGVIIDMAQAEHAIRIAVDKAERIAGLMLESVIVNFSAGRIKSYRTKEQISLSETEVKREHVQQLLEKVSHAAHSSERFAMHILPLSYKLDNHVSLSSPVGMFGNELSVDAHVITADAVTLQNIEACVNQAHLSVEAMVAAPLASSIACVLEDEMQLGAACIDFGAGSTSFSIFSEGHLVYTDSVPIGSNHITLDISRSLYTSIEEAERLKTLYGTSLNMASHDCETVTVAPLTKEEQPRIYSRRLLNRIIRARIEEMLEIMRDRLKRSGYYHTIGKRIVLVGGGSQLIGFGEVAAQIFGKDVRFGRPLGVSHLPGLANNAAFCSAAGLLVYPQFIEIKGAAFYTPSVQSFYGSSGRFSRVGKWLRESF